MPSSDEDCGFFKEKEVEIVNENKTVKFDDFSEDTKNKCTFCKNSRFDQEIFDTFELFVCKNCKFEKLKMITKTKCKDDYLIADDELNDFKFLTRKNPHKGNWSNMCLYLENQVKEFAIEKYGSLEEIENIKKNRAEKLMECKKNRVRKKIREHRRKTRVKIIKEEKKHVHNFEKIGNTVKCPCGLQYEEEEL